MLIVPILIFISVAAAVGGVAFLFMPTRVERRLESISGPSPGGAPGWNEALVTIAGPFAKLSAPEGDWNESPLRIRFINAGIRRADARLLYFGAKTGLPLAFAFLDYLFVLQFGQAEGMTLLMYLLMAALVGCYLPNLYVYLKLRERKREIFENFPDAADLMLVCVEAGLGMDAALSRITDEIRMKSKALAEELHLTNLEMRAGAAREQALRNLALRCGLEEIRTFATMLTQSDKFGTSMGESLRVFSDDLRHKRQMRAEELAAKVPTKMLFPLVAFIFPSVIMVVLGPAVIQIIRTVLPLLGARH